MADMDIDRSCLPPVQEVCRDFAVLEDGALAYCLQEQEIEQHYASNIQKHQLFQRDVQIAKKLQHLEKQASKRPVPEPQQQHGQETGSAPEGVRRKAEEGRQRKDHNQQAIAAKQLQDLEEHGKGERHRQKQRLKSWQGTRGDDTEPLSWAMAELELQGQQQQQLRQDEALAWKLHVEEQTQLRARKTQQRGDDYRAAQVAQDEEIARYIQDQELIAPRRSPSEDVGAQGFTEAHSGLSELRRSRGQEKEAQRSCTVASPVSVQSLESAKAPRGRGEGGGAAAAIKPQPCRNIAEDLDPTFKAKRMEPPAAEVPTCSQAAVPVQPVPVDGFFDYLDEVAESTFVPETKRQPEKLGRHKSGDRKEGCKQQ